MLEYPDGTSYFIHGRASFTDLAWYWNVLLGLFMMGANCAIKFMFRSIQDEQKMVAIVCAMAWVESRMGNIDVGLVKRAYLLAV